VKSTVIVKTMETKDYKLVYSSISDIPIISNNVVLEAIFGRTCLCSSLVLKPVSLFGKGINTVSYPFNNIMYSFNKFSIRPSSTVDGDTIDISNVIKDYTLTVGSLYHTCTGTIGDDFVSIIHRYVFPQVAGSVGLKFADNIPVNAQGFLYFSKYKNEKDSIVNDLVKENKIVNHSFSDIKKMFKYNKKVRTKILELKYDEV